MEDFTIDKVSWYRDKDVKHDVQGLRFRTIAIFLQDHGLTKNPLLEPPFVVKDDFCIRSTDLTEEGLQFMKLAYDKWLRAIGKGKSPEDTKLLEKALAQLKKE